MSDLISRQDAIDAIEAKEANEFGNYMEYNVAFNDGLRSAVFALEELPSAEPERKIGKWLKYDGVFDYDVKCSECECPNYYETDFCPNCGSYNGGEQDD